MQSERQYLDLFRTERALFDAGSCAPLNACRKAAAEALERHGLPTTKVERYKYCDVPSAFAPDYGLNLRRVLAEENPYDTYRCGVPNLSTSLYFVINDVVPPTTACTAPLPDGVVVTSLCDAAQKMPDFIAKFYHLAAGKNYDGVTALNTMLVQDGILVYIPDGVRLKHTIQLVNISAAGGNLMSNRRILVVAGRGAEATILFCDHAFGEQHFLTTQVVEVFADEMAKIDLYSIEETSAVNTRFNNVYAEQQAGSRVSYNGIMLTCGQTRNQLDFRLLGPGAATAANGAVIADGNQRVDNNILVDHAAAGCTSDLLYKYVLDGQSVGAFAGKVLVQRDAQQTESQQTNANICASPTARAFSQPMLEIYADDVKCNHGSSIGKLDETALFYMRQRGIPEAEARLLLQHAFINDVLQRVTLEHLRDRLSHLVDLRFRGQLSKCRDCAMCH
ncbi:MAG: Fe-S cluster assembly protein SufD [Bacteroidales bacterium]|nr:Fe-S cluster assembly protein SufD [Bacteroidales bacterium]